MTEFESQWSDERPIWRGLPVGRRVLVAEDDAAMRELLDVARSADVVIDVDDTGAKPANTCGSRPTRLASISSSPTSKCPAARASTSSTSSDRTVVTLSSKMSGVSQKDTRQRARA